MNLNTFCNWPKGCKMYEINYILNKNHKKITNSIKSSLEGSFRFECFEIPQNIGCQFSQFENYIVK